MSIQANKAVVLRLLEEAQSKGNLDVIDELLAEDFIDHTPPPGIPPTRAGFKMVFGYLRTAFPDLRVTVHEQIAEGDQVVTRKTLQGTHRGEFMGRPGTGRSVAFEVIDILTLQNGKICEHRLLLDRLAIQEQLGA